MPSFRFASRGIFGVAFLTLLLCWAPSARANLLGNQSFEGSIGGDTGVNWDDTNGATRISTPPTGFAAFPDGSGALLLDGTTEFTFQSNDHIHEGDYVSLSLVAQSNVTADGTSGGRVRLEFQRRDPDTKNYVLISAVNDDVFITLDNAPSGGTNAYVRFTVSATAPPRTARVVFVIRREGSETGNLVVDNVNGEVNPAGLSLSASKTNVRRGEVVTIIADFTNESAETFTNVDLKVTVPAGFDVLEDTIRRNGTTTTSREGSLLIASAASLAPNGSVRIVFQVLVTSGVSLGKVYEVLAEVTTANRLSEVAGLTFRIRGDPLFDEGTILGKVFDDRNEDGMQSRGERGVPRVRLYTESGVSVITDDEGRFHFPAVKPGRHVLKVDAHTFPAGTRFVTEESLLVKTTPGLLNKVRFGVHLPESALPEEFLKDLHVWVTQGVDLAQPKLEVLLKPNRLKAGLGRLDQEPTFRIRTNYGEYLASWRLEIQNEMGEKIWTGIGIAAPPTEVFWKGLLDNGQLITPGVYAYRLVVRDSQDHEDWTPLRFFRVIHKAESWEDKEETVEIPSIGNFNVSRDGKRSIPLVAKPMIRVFGKTSRGREVRVAGIPAPVGPEGEFEQELFVTAGEKRVTVTAADSEGETVTVEEKVTVKDSYFFLVALGEEEMGVNFENKNFKTVGRADEFDEGFYQEGRLAYYLKAKIRGKFLVKSRYDTGDKRSELFTQLDPDDYYPVYGDYSQLDYEGQETRERLFILVERDRSFLQWGSYQTDFTATELARYNRTLSGLKIHYETLSSSKYGDPKRGFVLFGSKADGYLADHNEFRATGGSLYYLRNRNVLAGSEKIRVEVRDKIQDIPTESRDLTQGRDYEIDYRQGRILLRRPLSSVSASETIISNDILDGNPVFLVVDYEFETFRLFEDHLAGLRGFTQVGDHFRVGGTAVEDKRQNADYDLRAVDLTYRTGRHTQVTAEFAQAKLQQVRSAASFDGGLSFRSQELLRSRRPREKAYLVKGESRPLEPLEVSGYLQNVEPGFSIDRIKSQEGFRKFGLQARLKLHPSFYLLGRHDSTEVSAQLRPLHLFGVNASFEKLRSTTGQAVFNEGPWKVVAEYLHQQLDVPVQNRLDSLFSESPFRNGVGLKIARRVSDWLTPYVKSQVTFSESQRFQVGGGLEARVGERTRIHFEEMLGKMGDSTLLGVETERDERTTSHANIRVQDRGFGMRRVSTSVGSSHALSEKSRIYSERQYSAYTGNLPFESAPVFPGESSPPQIWSSDVYGYETQFRDRWDVGIRFERRHLRAEDFRALSDEATDNLIRTNTFNTLALSLGYTDPKRFRWGSSGEVRLDPDSPEVRQWLTQNLMEWRVNQDLSFLGRANFGTSRFLESNDTTGRFLELNVGFAYRPVEKDRLNWLAKYSLVHEEASDAQFISSGEAGTVETDEQAHIFSIEGAYELHRYLQVVEKAAYRLGSTKTAVSDWVDVGTFLWLHRFNFHVTRKWDLGLEYRILLQTKAGDTFRHGPLVELDREFYDYVRLGIGYNFTDFDDDLRTVNNFKRNGLFFRLTGKV